MDLLNRREVLSRLSGLLTLVGGGLSFKLFSPTHEVVIFNQASSNTQHSFGSAEDFWTSHDDRYAALLNTEFKRQGKLLKIETFLGSDGKSAYLIKHYRSEADHLEYVRRLSEYHSQNAYCPKAKSRLLTA